MWLSAVLVATVEVAQLDDVEDTQLLVTRCLGTRDLLQSLPLLGRGVQSEIMVGDQNERKNEAGSALFAKLVASSTCKVTTRTPPRQSGWRPRRYGPNNNKILLRPRRADRGFA